VLAKIPDGIFHLRSQGVIASFRLRGRPLEYRGLKTL
jgi:hypothetical protein